MISLIVVLLVYFKDCKEIGKSKLAVSLGERLFAWFITFGLLNIFIILLIFSK